MIVSLLFLYSLVCSFGLLLMYGVIRLTRVCMTPHGRVAIIGSVLTVAVAAALPLLIGWYSRPTVLLEVDASMSEVGSVGMQVTEGVAPERAWRFSWFALFQTIYMVGLLFAFIKLCVTILRIIIIMLKSERHGNVLLSSRDDVVPFSWGGWIIMSRADYETDGELLMAHESAHRDSRHWLDLMLFNLLGCLTWYCPAMRHIRRELQSSHEFAADRAVLAKGFDGRTYQMLLIKKASGRRFANSVADCINNHSLKSRIIMMQKNFQMRHRVLRNLALVPAAVIVIALASTPVLALQAESFMPAKVVTVAQEPVAAPAEVIAHDTVPAEVVKPNTVTLTSVMPGGKEVSKTVNVADLQIVDDPVEPENQEEDMDKKVFTAVEKSPVFQGGDNAMWQYVNKNIRYPEECAERNIQGRVTVQFVVEKDGSVGDVKIIRGVDPQLDGEAVRLVRTFPKFEPGTMNGEPVRVWYTFPVNFRLAE